MGAKMFKTKTYISKTDLVLPEGQSSVRLLKKLIYQGGEVGELKPYNGLTDIEIKNTPGVHPKYEGQYYKKFKLKPTVDEVYISVKRFDSETMQIVGKIPRKDRDFFQMALKHCAAYQGKAKIIGGAKKISKNGRFTTYQNGEYGIELEIVFFFKEELEEYGFIMPKKIPQLNPMDVSDYVVIDLELIMGEYLFTEIIEIGAIKYRGDKEIDRFQAYVKPKQRIPSIIKKITNISYSLVKDASPIEVLLPRFLDFIKDLPLVGHGIANSDIKVIKTEMYRHNIGFLTNPFIDTLPLSKQTYPLSHHKLEQVKEYLKMDLTSHEAINDCLVANRIFQDFKKKKLEGKNEE